jgi:serine/threonine protein kinase
VTAINELHARNYIHRDLKLENIMLTSPSSLPSSPIPLPSLTKIIDLGEMVKLPSHKSEYVMKGRPPGSLGYFAPETVKDNLNSFATDMFQIGCILYAMLSGTPAFRSNLTHSIEGNYHPMTGEAWEGISSHAKDLVHQLLQINPKDRLTSSAVLHHPWLVTNASKAHLGSNYVSRVHHLMLRQKLKKFFLRSDVLQDQRIRQEGIDDVLARIEVGHGLPKTPQPSDHCDESDNESHHPELEHWGSESYRSSPYSAIASPIKHDYHSSPLRDSILTVSSTSSFFEEMSRKSFRFKLIDMKNTILNSLSPSPSSSPSCSSSSGSSSHTLGHLLSKKSISYSEFCQLMNGFDLAELTNEDVFKIFDIRNDGLIRMRDFLLTLLTFVDALSLSRPDDSMSVHHKPPCLGDRHRHPAEIYFCLFDLNGNGTIDKHELQILFHLLMDDLSIDHQQSPETVLSPSTLRRTSSVSSPPLSLESDTTISDLYALIGDKEQISYEEFKVFYETVISSETRGVGTITCAPNYHSLLHILTSNRESLPVKRIDRDEGMENQQEEEEEEEEEEKEEEKEEEAPMKQGRKRKKRVCEVAGDSGPITRSRRKSLMA